MDKSVVAEKLAIPVAIVIAALSFAVSYYFVQVNRQTSIEQQQRLEMAEEQEQRLSEEGKVMMKQKQSECEALADGVRGRWNNVLGVTYDSEFWEECIVTYTNTDTGDVETSPLRLMQDAN